MKATTKLPSLRESFPCSYFGDGRMSSIEYLYADEESAKRYHEFLAAGYRRLGSIFYRNVCGECRRCKPLRLETERFRPSRSQRRTLRKNRDVRLQIHSSASLTVEKFDLYRGYLDSKHSGKGEKEIRDYETVLSNIHYGYAHTIEMDYYDGDRLIGVGIVDEAEDSLSSNYFYYDTDYLHRRPGVFSVLKEILLARVMGKKYYYLGFYIEETAKMSYKKLFRPNEIYEDSGWREFFK
jgi:arginyl-tRNA--protein-N-Asp/Glu arginylyltransferase